MNSDRLLLLTGILISAYVFLSHLSLLSLSLSLSLSLACFSLIFSSFLSIFLSILTLHEHDYMSYSYAV